MSRYINVNELIERFAVLTKLLWLDSVEEAEIVSLIGNSPSIDIVRCGECKHQTYCYGDVLWTNKRQTVDIHKEIDFCSCGERECSDVK